MEIILSHNNLDCDGLAAVVAMSRLRPSAIPVLMGNLNRNVRDLLARDSSILHSVRLRDLSKEAIDRVYLVDAQTIPSDEALLRRLRESNPQIEIFDHHPPSESCPPSAIVHYAATGATTTMLVEDIQQCDLAISSNESTILLLGIYEDTGHLTYATTTPRDVRAAAWLLEQGADLNTISDYIDRPLSTRQWEVYEALLASVSVDEISGYTVLLASASSSDYVEEVSTLAHKLTDLYEPDASFILVEMDTVVQIIARSRNPGIDVAAILKPLGGGGHQPAAAALVRDRSIESVRSQLWSILRQGMVPAVSAADLMTREVHSVSAGDTIAGAHAALRRYGHEALPILDNGRLIGLIMRRDADKAMHHGMGSRPVEAFATFDVPIISPQTTLAEIQDVMQENRTGQIPVVDGGQLVGMVTRTDIAHHWRGSSGSTSLADRVKSVLASDVFEVITLAGSIATDMGFSLYLVGGFVRDLLLGQPTFDLDLVVEGDAIALCTQLAQERGGRTISHTRFGTAKWLAGTVPGHAHPARPLALDFVTARTEFYEHPAALPVVEASSLRHDLYRRDFTINTMAICLNGQRYGNLIDFYGGRSDLEQKQIRVLHNLSFVEDATRILRAARQAERLGFNIEERTAALIADAWDSLDRVSGDRLRHEMYLIFGEAAPERILAQLDRLGVLLRLHSGLRYTNWLADRFAAVRVALPAWSAWGWGNGGSGGDHATALAATYLALLAYSLSDRELDQLMARLCIAAEPGRVLRQVWAIRSILPQIAGGLRLSQIYHFLQPYLIEAIVIVAIADDRAIVRQAIASYITDLRHTRTQIDGMALRALGIAPGPVYSRVLGAILDARLDGIVKDRGDEDDLLQRLLADEISRQ